MNRLFQILAVFLLPGAAMPALADTPRVLLVVSSHGRDEGTIQPGFEMDELAQAQQIFAANNIATVIASPAGGAVVADKYDPKKVYNAAFLNNPAQRTMLANSLRLDPAMADDYAAVLVIGGKGAMFDLPFSQSLHALLAMLEAKGGVIGAVCHGPAVFARMRLADGTAFAAGRRITGFADEEEVMFGERWTAQYPFLLETALRTQGALFGEAAIMLPHVEVDGRLVTGQNPYSVAATTEAMIRAMGRTPAPRTPWADERAMALVARLIAGDATARAEFAARPGDYDVPHIAIWGYYRAQMEGLSRADLASAIAVMELALPHFNQPQLVQAISAAKARLAAMDG